MEPSISYSLTEDDYLDFQMYTSILLPSHQKQRFRSLLLPCFLGTLIGVYAIIRSEPIMAACLFFYSGLWLVFNRKYTHWRYQQHFRKYIKETQSSNLGVEATITLGEHGLLSDSLKFAGSMEYSAIESITEIKSLWLIKLENENTVLIPKNGITQGDLGVFMKTLSQKSGIPLVNDSERRWK